MSSPLVPIFAPNLYPHIARIGSGKPVLANTWQSAAKMANWVAGRGCTLVSGTGGILGAGVTHTFRYWVYDDDWHSTRCWVITLAKSQMAMYAWGASDICFGTIVVNGNTHRFSFSGPPACIYLPENYTVTRGDPTAHAGEEVTCVITPDAASGTVELMSLQLVEVPKLLLDDEGAKDDTIGALKPIYDNTSGDANASVAGVGQTMEFARTISRRGGMFAWSDGGVGAVTRTAGTFADLFPIYPALQTRNTTEDAAAVRAVKVHVYAKVSGGASGEVKFTMDSGDTLTLTVTSATGAWVSGTVDVSVDVATATNGGTYRSGGVDGDRDECQVEYRISAGAGTLTVYAVCINDPCGL